MMEKPVADANSMFVIEVAIVVLVLVGCFVGVIIGMEIRVLQNRLDALEASKQASTKGSPDGK
jgi:hypothetical protein